MAENLKATRFNDGTEIVHVNDNGFKMDWPTPRYAIYNDDPLNKERYGVLYNFRVIEPTYLVNYEIAPPGWHVPTNEDWKTLINFLGGENLAGGKLKSTGISENGTGNWKSPNTGASNEFGFGALPGGYATGSGDYSCSYYQIAFEGSWWSSTHSNQSTQYLKLLYNKIDAPILEDGVFTGEFRSIRCVKD